MQARKGWEHAVSVVTTETWKDELVLITDLVAVNKLISRYVLHALDADAGRVDPMAPSDEHHLGTRLIELADQLQARATLRSTHIRSCVTGSEHPARADVWNRSREIPPPWTNPGAAVYEP